MTMRWWGVAVGWTYVISKAKLGGWLPRICCVAPILLQSIGGPQMCSPSLLQIVYHSRTISVDDIQKLTNQTRGCVLMPSTQEVTHCCECDVCKKVTLSISIIPSHHPIRKPWLHISAHGPAGEGGGGSVQTEIAKNADLPITLLKVRPGDFYSATAAFMQRPGYSGPPSAEGILMSMGSSWTHPHPQRDSGLVTKNGPCSDCSE